MGNLLGKDCPSEVKPAVKRPQGVGWKPPGETSTSCWYFVRLFLPSVIHVRDTKPCDE